MVLSIWDEMLKISDNFREWIIRNSTNPILWIGLLFLGLFLFVFTYHALNKQK